MTRREFVVASTASALVSAADTRPNIVFLILDDLGSGDLGCYGQQHILTPNIDRIAAAGMRFTNAYAGAAVCAPSRAVLMTGLHGGHAPVRANAGTVPITRNDTTVAAVLKAAGYATGGFGKWGLGDAGSDGAPEHHGFDEFFGYLHQVHAHSYFPEFLWDNGQKLLLPGNIHGSHAQYSGDLIAERSLNFVRRHRDRPFFLYATWTLPHGKFEVPDVKPYEARNWPDGHKTYAAMVTRADTWAGQLFDLLRKLDLERNTVVFVTSDNGAPAGEDKGFTFFRSNGDLRGQKGQVYEGGIRVPLIVRWPGHIRPGSVSSLPVAFCDMMNTLAELAGKKSSAQTDGISIVPALLGRNNVHHREFLYWEHDTYDPKTGTLRDDRLLQALRMGRWKAIRNGPARPLELYDLISDPGETTNVATTNATVVAKMEMLMKNARTPPRPHNSGSMQWVR